MFTRFIYGLLLGLTLFSSAAAPAFGARNDVIVVPARRRMVALATDVRALRHAILVTYQADRDGGKPLMHVWDARRRVWDAVSPEHFSAGQYLNGRPATMYIVGLPDDVPETVNQGAEQARKVIRIETLAIAEAANRFHKSYKFSPREWRAIGERNGLEIRDLNYEQRRWGRFGPPGTPYGPNAPAGADEEAASLDKASSSVQPGDEATGEVAMDEPSDPAPTAVATEETVLEAPSEEPVTEASSDPVPVAEEKGKPIGAGPTLEVLDMFPEEK